MTSTRPREGRGIRHAAGGENDRLKRAVLQPVQCWDKKWTESKNGKQLQVFKWIKSDRQVEFDDDDDDEEIEQAPVPRQVEEIEEVGTPAPALPTLQDADDTTASTPAQTGEEEDEEDDTDGLPKPTSHPLSQSYSESDRRPSSSSHQEIPPQSLTRDGIKLREQDRDGIDEEDDTDSSRPLVFTPSLETPVETQANTPQDFESMSPAAAETEELEREVQVDLVVKGLDEGQAEMEEEMEEEEVVKEKEHIHPVGESDLDMHNNDGVNRVAVSGVVNALDSSIAAVSDMKTEDDSIMEVDTATVPLL